MAMQLMIRRDVAMEVWRYNGRQRDGRDEAFVGGGSGSKSNSILLVVRDSTPDCHTISKKNLSFMTVQVLENASGTRSGTESLPKVFLHDNCEQISYYFFRLSQKGRNEKRDSFYTAKRVSSVHSCCDETRWPYFQSRSPKTSSDRVSSLDYYFHMLMEPSNHG
jgi:hypothetical protein